MSMQKSNIISFENNLQSRQLNLGQYISLKIKYDDVNAKITTISD